MLKATSEFLNVCPRCLTLRQYRQQNKFFIFLKVARFLRQVNILFIVICKRSNYVKSTLFVYSSPSHYDVLNVPKDASQDEIKKAFFEKSKKVLTAQIQLLLIEYCFNSLIIILRNRKEVQLPFILQFHPDVSPSNPHHHKFFLKV